MVGIKYVLMRKLLILAIFGLLSDSPQAEDSSSVPDFRPAKVEPTTVGAEAPAASGCASSGWDEGRPGCRAG